MKKKWLITGISTLSVILLILASLANVIGYQTAQSSNQSVIKERINQRELLFQTICDIANNKEIQRNILKSQMSGGIFPISEFPAVYKNQIRQMYFLGMILSKVVSKSRMQSIVQKYQLHNPITQEGIQGVIEKDATLKGEITQLQNSECDCEKDSSTIWRFPVICVIINILIFSLAMIWFYFGEIELINIVIDTIQIIFWIIGVLLNCRWAYLYPIN